MSEPLWFLWQGLLIEFYQGKTPKQESYRCYMVRATCNGPTLALVTVG